MAFVVIFKIQNYFGAVGCCHLPLELCREVIPDNTQTMLRHYSIFEVWSGVTTRLSISSPTRN